MSVTYKPAPPVEQIGRKLIGRHHTALADVTVEFVFRSEHAERHGQQVWGKARKVSGLNAFLAHWASARAVGEEPLGGDDGVEPFFVIEIAEDIWTILTPAQKEALVDHELSHCKTKLNKDEEVVLYVAPHEVEEFVGVVERHGRWRQSIQHMVDRMYATGQLSFEDQIVDGDAEDAIETTGELATAGSK